MTRRSINTTPWMDGMVAAVQTHLQGARGRRPEISYSEAVAWIIDDFAWCDPDKPAFGRMSPVMSGIVEKLLEARP